jgi:hypothetical protein
MGYAIHIRGIVVRLPAGAREFPLSKRFRPVHEPTQLPIEADVVVFRGVKQPKREANYFHVVRKLTLILLTWRIWWASNNASKWQMGFNLAFEVLKVGDATPPISAMPSWIMSFLRYYYQSKIRVCYIKSNFCILWYSGSSVRERRTQSSRMLHSVGILLLTFRNNVAQSSLESNSRVRVATWHVGNAWPWRWWY